MKIREAKNIYYFSDILDLYPSSLYIELLEKIRLNKQNSIQSFLIKDNENTGLLLRSFEFEENKRECFEYQKKLSNSHVNLFKLLSLRFVSDTYTEVLYEYDGVDISTYLQNENHSLEAIINVGLQTASALSYIHSTKMNVEEFSGDYVRMCNGIVKITGFICFDKKEVKSPKVLIAESLETREQRSVFLWSNFMLKTCLRYDYSAQYKSEDEYKRSLTNLKIELERTINKKLVKILIDCMQFDSSKKPTFKQILEELYTLIQTKNSVHKEANPLPKEIAYSIEIKGKTITLSEKQSFAMQKLDEKSLINISNALINNAPIISLNLDVNDIKLKGVEIIAKGIEKNCILKSLLISNNGIGDQGAKILVSAISSSKSLTELDLSNNNLTTIAASFIAPILDTILILNVANNELGDEGVEVLCKSIALNVKFNSLDVGSNKLTDKACSLLSDIISLHQNFTCLYVDGNEVTDKGAHALSVAITKSSCFHTLYLGRNKVTDIGAKSLSDAIRQSLVFKKIILYGNLLTDWGYDLIFSSRK